MVTCRTAPALWVLGDKHFTFIPREKIGLNDVRLSDLPTRAAARTLCNRGRGVTKKAKVNIRFIPAA
jgi:hypothetical protein